MKTIIATFGFLIASVGPGLLLEGATIYADGAPFVGLFLAAGGLLTAALGVRIFLGALE